MKLPMNTVQLKCKVEGDSLETITTNCPIEDVKAVAELVMDAHINLCEGEEVDKLINCIRALGYTAEPVVATVVEI